MIDNRVLKNVQARAKKVVDAKTKTLEEIQTKLAEAKQAKKDAEEALKKSASQLDLERYEKSQAALQKAQTAINMYSDRYDQLQRQEYVTEEDSDTVIASLLAYEKDLDEDFKETLGKALRGLYDLLKGYKGAIDETEKTLTHWTTVIHRNYRNYAGTTYADGSNRNTTPIPVHPMPYFGCKESGKLGNFLKDLAPLFVADEEEAQEVRRIREYGK